MMIFLPNSRNLESCCVFELPLPVTAPTTALTWANCLMVSCICSSRMRRSVTTMIESKTSWPFFRTAISWCASQAIEFDLPLPAECWIRYLLPEPSAPTSARSFLTTSSWW